jgi:hypothetical protein
MKTSFLSSQQKQPLKEAEGALTNERSVLDKSQAFEIFSYRCTKLTIKLKVYLQKTSNFYNKNRLMTTLIYIYFFLYFY